MRKITRPLALALALAAALTSAEAAKRDNSIRFAYDQAPGERRPVLQQRPHRA
jgi:hypothetical protein